MPHTNVAKQRKLEQQAIQLRDELLKDCGWPVEKRRRALGKALRVYERQLEAQKVLILNGETTYVPDNQAQLRAAEAWTTLEGVNVGKSHEGQSSGPVQINVVLPWFKPEDTIGSSSSVVDVSPHANPLIEHDSQ